MTPENRAELLKQVRMLEHPNIVPFMERHGLTNADVWPDAVAKEALRVARKAHKRRTPATSSARIRLLKAQDGKCGLCRQAVGPFERSCLDRTGVVVCGGCNMVLGSHRMARANGITEEMLIEFDTTE